MESTKIVQYTIEFEKAQETHDKRLKELREVSGIERRHKEIKFLEERIEQSLQIEKEDLALAKKNLEAEKELYIESLKGSESTTTEINNLETKEGKLYTSIKVIYKAGSKLKPKFNEARFKEEKEELYDSYLDERTSKPSVSVKLTEAEKFILEEE